MVKKTNYEELIRQVESGTKTKNNFFITFFMIYFTILFILLNIAIIKLLIRYVFGV